MKISTIALVSACFLTPSVAFAQTSAPDTGSTAKETPAVSTPGDKNPDAPVKGENSFTEDQAKSRIEEAGYNSVMDLKLGEDGIWNASAMKGADKVQVQLDYQGNVTTKAM